MVKSQKKKKQNPPQRYTEDCQPDINFSFYATEFFFGFISPMHSHTRRKGKKNVSEQQCNCILS